MAPTVTVEGVDPKDVDRRFAELVASEFGDDRSRWPGMTPDDPAPQPRKVTPARPQTPPPVAPTSRTEPDPWTEPESWTEPEPDYRTPAPRGPLPPDITIAAIFVAAGLTALVLAAVVTQLPSVVRAIGPLLAVAGLGWLVVRAMRRPPRDPDDDGIHL